MGNVKINFLGYDENTLVKKIREDFSNENGIGEPLKSKILNLRENHAGQLDVIIAILVGFRTKGNNNYRIKKLQDNYKKLAFSTQDDGKGTWIRNMLHNSVGITVAEDGSQQNREESSKLFNGFVDLINEKYNIEEKSFTLGDIYNMMNDWDKWGIGNTNSTEDERKKKKESVLSLFNLPQSESIENQDTEEKENNADELQPTSILSINEQNYNAEENEDTNVNNDLRFPKNTILYGPPGTGKTYNTAIYAAAICKNKTIEEVSKWKYEKVMKQYNELKKDKRIAFTTFHQSYGYEEFIEGIRPIMNFNKKSVGSSKETEFQNGKLEYEIKDGIFKEFCDKAAGKLNENYVFIIDEINRGNISKIFGELITLIEETKRKGMIEGASAKLPYSHDDFSVPPNVYIIGTMNTADRSIALMDTALRRRFSFIEMMPNSSILKDIEIEGIDIKEMFETMNNRIEFLFDREHTIGHAFFMGLKQDCSINKLCDIFKNSVIPLLQEYFYEDYEKIRLVLGDNDKPKDYQFILKKSVKPRNLFKGISELDDGNKYTINSEAFNKINSYIGIYDENDEALNSDTEQFENEIENNNTNENA